MALAERRRVFLFALDSGVREAAKRIFEGEGRIVVATAGSISDLIKLTFPLPHVDHAVIIEKDGDPPEIINKAGEHLNECLEIGGSLTRFHWHDALDEASIVSLRTIAGVQYDYAK